LLAQPLRPRQHGQEAVLLAEGADVDELAIALGFCAEIERLRQQGGVHRAAHQRRQPVRRGAGIRLLDVLGP
jgi:hypothetical protein